MSYSQSVSPTVQKYGDLSPVVRRLDFSNDTLQINPNITNLLDGNVNSRINPELISHVIENYNPIEFDLPKFEATPIKLDESQIKSLTQMDIPVKRKCCGNYWLGLSFIPIIGTIPSIASQCILAGKLKKTSDSGQMASLLTRINQFKVASITRTLLTLAAVIAVLAFGLLTGGIGLAVGIGLVVAASALGMGLTIFHGIQHHTNKGEIKNLLNQPAPEKLN